MNERNECRGSMPDTCFTDTLRAIVDRRPLVLLGVGSELRGDDAWPYHLIIRLKKIFPPDVHCLWGATLPENFVKPIAALRPGAVLICDSAQFGGAPGEVRLFKGSDLADEAFLSHRMPLKALAGLMEERAQCPVYFLFMQPVNIELSDGLSPAVRKSLKELAAAFKELAEPR